MDFMFPVDTSLVPLSHRTVGSVEILSDASYRFKTFVKIYWSGDGYASYDMMHGNIGFGDTMRIQSMLKAKSYIISDTTPINKS
jgi:hypothetical protein